MLMFTELVPNKRPIGEMRKFPAVLYALDISFLKEFDSKIMADAFEADAVGFMDEEEGEDAQIISEGGDVIRNGEIRLVRYLLCWFSSLHSCNVLSVFAVLYVEA